MKQRVLRDALTSLSSLGALLALAVVPPWALASSRGWPLPTELPSLAAVSRALQGASISDEVLLNALACLCWIAWLLLTISVVVELAAWIRGHAPQRVLGAGSLQPFARRLVVSATLLVGTLRSSPIADAAVVRAAPVSVIAVQLTPTAMKEQAPPDFPICVVGARDSLWRIAERHLGDPFRWREIHELNRGRTYPDGRTFGDPDLIHPGWDLRLPADAIGVASVVVVPPAPVVDVDLSQAIAPASITEREKPAAEVADQLAAADEDPDVNSFPVPIAVAAATLLAAGTVRLVTDLRRRQRRLRLAGHAMPIPTAPARHAERVLRAAAADESADRLDLALRALGAQLATTSGAELARVEAVRVGEGTIEVLLDRTLPASSGLFLHEAGRVWTLSDDVSLGEIAGVADERGCLVPALVSIGRSDNADVLIDLELSEPLRVHGSADEVGNVLWALALDLAVHSWADDVQIVSCGLPEHGLSVVDRVEIREDLLAAVDDIERATASTEQVLREQQVQSTWHGRLSNAGDGWTPTVVIIGPHVAPGISAEAIARLTGLPGVAVVAYEPSEVQPGHRRALLVKGADIALLPLGLVLRSPALPADLASATVELITSAASSEPGPPLHSDGPEQSVIDLREREKLDPKVGSDDVLVRIMGRVEIEGGRRPIDRRRVTELVVLLALHPRGLTEGQIKSALWVDLEPSTNAFNQVISRARVALGLDADGDPHIRFVEDCLYKPGAHLKTDWSILERAWSRASRDPSPYAIAHLREALDLVRGLPFEGTKGYEWAYERGIPSRIEAVVDEARELVNQAVAAAV